MDSLQIFGWQYWVSSGQIMSNCLYLYKTFTMLAINDNESYINYHYNCKIALFDLKRLIQTFKGFTVLVIMLRYCSHLLFTWGFFLFAACYNAYLLRKKQGQMQRLINWKTWSHEDTEHSITIHGNIHGVMNQSITEPAEPRDVNPSKNNIVLPTFNLT